MNWKLTNGDVDFITIHDDCPDKVRQLVMVVIDVYLCAISDPFSEPYCEVDCDDM